MRKNTNDNTKKVTKSNTRNSASEKTKKVSAKKPELSIEQSFEVLDGIVEELEDEHTSIEVAFAKYEEGMRMINDLNQKISEVERKIIMLEEAQRDVFDDDEDEYDEEYEEELDDIDIEEDEEDGFMPFG